MSGEHRCIACGYDLKGLPADGAGHARCPECGASNPPPRRNSWPERPPAPWPSPLVVALRLTAVAWLAGGLAVLLSLLEFRVSVVGWIVAAMASWVGPLVTAGSLAVDHAKAERREAAFLGLAAAGVAANMTILGLLFALWGWAAWW